MQRVITSAVLDLLRELLAGQRGARDGAVPGIDRVQLATVALLVEAAHMDDEFGPTERAKLAELVEERFGLTATESRALLAAADEKVRQAADVFGFTIGREACRESGGHDRMIRVGD